MKKYVDDIALWIGIVSGILSFVLLFSKDDLKWSFFTLVALAILLIVFSIVMHIIEKRTYPASIDGIHINALELIDSTFVLNKNISLETADIEVKITGKDIFYKYIYEGKILNNVPSSEQGLYFNIASEHNDAEKRNKYFAFDLISDPDREQKLEMNLCSPAGMSNALFVHFPKTLKKNEKYKIEINGEVYGPVPEKGISYYFVRFSFGQSVLFKKTINYKFKFLFDKKIEWVSKNRIDGKKHLTKFGKIMPREGTNCIYIDSSKVTPNDIYVYTFKK